MKNFKRTIAKLQEIESEIAHERGDLFLFAVFLPEGALNKWDLLISAPWVTNGAKDSIEYVVEKLQRRFKPNEMLTFARVAPIPPDHPSLLELSERYQVMHGDLELRNFEFFSIDIKCAHFITLNRPAAIASKP
jgi:hypothetical protein